MSFTYYKFSIHVNIYLLFIIMITLYFNEFLVVNIPQLHMSITGLQRIL